MAQTGKFSSKKGKPSYVMAIVGVTAVLFITALFGWIILNAGKYSKVLREDVEIHVYLTSTAQQKTIDELKNYIAAKPYTRTVEFIDKETARKRWTSGGDKDFMEFLDNNPLPSEISLKVKSDWVNKDSLNNIATDLSQNQLLVQSVDYPKNLVEKITNVVKWVVGILIGLSILFGLLALLMIDNTIRLAMYSNRFLIKTMQMVGATRWFIAKPMNIRAIINGAIAGAIAIALVLGVINLVENFVPDFKILRENSKLIILFISVVLLGIGISLVSTHRSVIKYLKMRLDDLY
ncbi:MAG: permease-like cell division protein FtsX [Chitinophagaceae bacterium]